MPSKRKGGRLDVPDISEDAGKRKRVLNILAQRRYRERRRERLQNLQARLEKQNQVHEQSNAAGCSPRAVDEEVSVTALNHLWEASATSDWVQPLEETFMGPELTATAGILPNLELMEDTFDANPFAPSLPFLSLLSPSISPSALLTGSGSPTLSSSGSNYQSLEGVNLPEIANNLSDQLQLYQASTFSFPDDHLIEIPSLTLLNAAVQIAQRLNVAHILWDFTAISPFYKGSSSPTQPSSSNSTSTSSTLSSASDDGDQDMSTLPPHLQPTPSQLLIPHHPTLDILPWPSTRDKLIQVFNLPTALRPKSAQDPIGLLRLIYDMEDVGGEGIKVRGQNAFSVEGWEIGQVMFERWWWAFEMEIVERSDRERKRRGEKPLSLSGVSF